MHDAGYGPPRTPLLRTSVNRLWALLLACPLHAVDHLLRLGQELLQAEGDDSSHMVTVCPFASSNTMKRSFSPLYAPDVSPLLTWNRGRSIHPGARSPIQQGRHEAPQTHLMLDEHDADPRREIFFRNPILSVVPEPASAHSSPSPPYFRFPIFRRP
jgi:hypothetical protein